MLPWSHTSIIGNPYWQSVVPGMGASHPKFVLLEPEYDLIFWSSEAK